MQEEVKTVDGTLEKVLDKVNTTPEQVVEEVKKVELITDPQQRIEALHEIQVLSGLISTKYHLPKWDLGNKGKQDRKITGSTELNFFSGDVMNIWGKRVQHLSEGLGYNG